MDDQIYGSTYRALTIGKGENSARKDREVDQRLHWKWIVENPG